MTLIDTTKELKSDAPLTDLAKKYLKVLLSNNRHMAYDLIMKAIDNGHDIKDIYLSVFQRTQREIGYLWQTNQISIVQEHYCTAVTQDILAKLYPSFLREDETGHQIIIACIGGELHELGARMVADFFEMSGWETHYFGANTHVENLLAVLNTQSPDILGISVTMTSNIPQAKELIEQIKTDHGTKDIKIIVGGRAFNSASRLSITLDIDGYAEDADSAVKLANRLLKK